MMLRTILYRPNLSKFSAFVPNKSYTDMVGPTDEASNLKRMKFYKAPNETPLQKLYREKRIETYEWNLEFWKNHNKSFVQERREFIKENANEDKPSLNADEMSVFYKKFLDKNWNNHFQYNISWYKKNIYILSLSIRVNIEKIYLKLKL